MSGLAARREEPRPETIIIPELDLHSFLSEPQLLDSLEQTEIPRLARNPEAMNLLGAGAAAHSYEPLSSAWRCA